MRDARKTLARKNICIKYMYKYMYIVYKNNRL